MLPCWHNHCDDWQKAKQDWLQMNESDLSLPATNTVQPAFSLRRIVKNFDRAKKKYMLVTLLGWIAIMLLSGGEPFRGDWQAVSKYIPVMLITCIGLAA